MAAAVGPFTPSLFAQWAADDFLIVEGFLREFPTWASFLRAAFVENFGATGGLYRPVGHTALYADLRVFGPVPLALHATNILWHAAVCVLVLGLARRLLTAPARLVPLLCAGIYFAAFPRRVEPVAWVSCRPDLVAATLGCAAVLQWPRAQGMGGGLASVGLGTGWLLAKETPVLLQLAFPFASPAGPSARSFLRLWPFAVAAGLVGVMRRVVLGDWVGGGGTRRASPRHPSSTL